MRIAVGSRTTRPPRGSTVSVFHNHGTLIRAKVLPGHGRFGAWLDEEFSLSRRSAEQFTAAARRFGARSGAVSHLPAGAVLELSAPSVPDELVEGALSAEV